MKNTFIIIYHGLVSEGVYCAFNTTTRSHSVGPWVRGSVGAWGDNLTYSYCNISVPTQVFFLYLNIFI